MSTMLDYLSAALAEFEGLLIAEIAAGNTITGTPASACGRVAFGIACALVRSFVKHSTQSALAG